MTSNKVNHARRKFFAWSVAAGVGTVVVAESSAHAVTLDESRCNHFFLTDNLADYGRAVDSVLSDVLSQTLVSVSVTLDQCIALHHRLECLITCLETELSSTGQGEEVRQIRELCEACRISAQQIKSSLKTQDQDVRALASGLAVMSKQVCDRARKLLPDQDLTLSKKAVAILRDIICLINDEEFLEFNKQLAGYGSYTKQAKDLIAQFTDIRNSLTLAREAVMRIENPCFKGDREADRKVAESNVGATLAVLKAIVLASRKEPSVTIGVPNRPISFLSLDFLKSLPDVKTDITNFEKERLFSDLPKGEQALTPVDWLIVNLVWVKKEVRIISPPVSDKKQCEATSDKGGGYERTSSVPYARVATYSEPVVPDELINSISLLLGRTCPPGSTDQATQCKKIIEGVRRGRSLCTDENCKRAIRAGLKLSEYFGSMPLLSCPDAKARERLVLGLFDRL